MAKSKRKISPADVPPGMVLVRSRAYGDHLRAKRGTYKKAKLNPALKKGAVFIREANAAAKLFRDAVEPYRKGLVEKALWPNLIRMFIDGYKLRAIVLFPDFKKKTVKILVEESPILSMKGEPAPFDVSVSVPGRTKCFILCLRIDGYSTGKVHYTIATKGMKVIAAGMILG